MDFRGQLLLWLLLGMNASVSADMAPIQAQRLASFMNSERLLTRHQLATAPTILPSVEGHRLFIADKPVQVAGMLVAQQLYYVYRPLFSLKDPYQGHELGQKLQFLGTIKRHNKQRQSHYSHQANISTAHIITQQREFRVGDKVLSLPPNKLEPLIYYPKPGPPVTQAYILSLSEQRNMVGAGGVVFINKGRHHGLSVGDVYSVIHPSSLAPPHLEVGRVMIFQLAELTSRAWVLSAQQELRLNYPVRALSAK